MPEPSLPTAGVANGSSDGAAAAGVQPSIGTTILNPPETLQPMKSRLLMFLSFSALLIGVVWFSICISLYVVGVEYHVMNVMYESRWLPITILFAGLSAAMLGVWKTETFYIGCAFMALYNCSSCIVAIVVYSLDFRKALYKMHPPITRVMMGQPRRKYLQLCGCMIIVALLGFCVSILLVAKLWQLASWYYKRTNLHRTQRGYLILSALVQLPLIWFSIYVTSHVISLPFSYVHQYMIQELLCALTLKAIVILQALHYVRANRLTMKLLLILNGCQTVQEVFYTWNSYYISLYIHTSKAKLALGADADQYLMSANFVGHFARMCIAAYTTYQLSAWLQAPFVNAYCRLELDRRARQTLVGLAAMALLLAASHVIMDVLYTVTSHIYRTLIAFTGISVFYLSLIGVALAMFVRSGHMLLLIIAAVFMLLLAAVSAHALYIFVDTSLHNSLLTHLDTMGKDKRQSTYMHFAESCLALLAMILCLIGGAFIFRILHIDSVHDRRDGRLRKPMLCLFALGVVQLELAAVNAALIVSVRDDSRVFQSMLAYGVLDSISMFVLCLTQIYVCRPGNNHISYGLTALLLFLICETLTTYNYLSTKTTYVQLLIVFSQMFAGNPVARQSLNTLFPADEVGLMVAAHVVQLLQWFLTIVSLVLAACALEMLHEQRKELHGSISTSQLQQNETIATIGGGGGVSAPLPAVSYSVSNKGGGQQTTTKKTSSQIPGVGLIESSIPRREDDSRRQPVGAVSNGTPVQVSSYDNPSYDGHESAAASAARRTGEDTQGGGGELLLPPSSQSEQQSPSEATSSLSDKATTGEEGNEEKLISQSEEETTRRETEEI